MTEPKWTPGPHFVEIMRSQITESDDADITYTIYDKNKNEIVTFYIESDEALANANLYAAAPDLYAATDFLKHFNLTEVSDETMLAIPVPYIRAILKARRKARGE